MELKPFYARGRSLSIIVFSVFVFLALSAFGPLPQDPAGGTILDRILTIATSFAALAGISGAVAMLVAVLRAFGVVKTDEQGRRATATLNLIAFLVLIGFGVFRPDLELDFLDGIAAQIAAIGLFVLGFIVQMGTPAPVNRALFTAGVPVLGAMGPASFGPQFSELIVSRAVESEEGPAKNWTTDPEEVRKSHRH